MLTHILTILILSTIYSFILYFYIRNIKKKEKILITKLKEIKDELIRKSLLKFKEYHNYFRIISYLSNSYKPYILSTYFYNHDEKLDAIKLSFAFQLSNDSNPIFTEDLNDIPISNSNFLTNAYYKKSFIFLDDIETLDKYDNELLSELKSRNINKFYLINIFPEKKGPTHTLPIACLN